MKRSLPVELTDLTTFSAVARTGGITRAAEELNTVQSNVTQRVKALEAEIGAVLFERHSRGMTLTGAGRRLKSLADLRAGTPESGPTALVFRTGCTYRQRLEQILSEFGWPSATRFELGTL